MPTTPSAQATLARPQTAATTAGRARHGSASTTGSGSEAPSYRSQLSTPSSSIELNLATGFATPLPGYASPASSTASPLSPAAADRLAAGLHKAAGSETSAEKAEKATKRSATPPAPGADFAPTSRWARALDTMLYSKNPVHAATTTVVTGIAQVAMRVPHILENPGHGLAAAAVGAVVNGIVMSPFGAINRETVNKAALRALPVGTSKRRRALLSLAPLLVRALGNLRHGAAMDALGIVAHVGTQAGTQSLLDNAPFAVGKQFEWAASQLPWLAGEAARFGGLFAVEQVARAVQVGQVARGLEAARALAAAPNACNSLGVPCETPMNLIAVPGTHLSFSYLAPLSVERNQLVSVQDQFYKHNVRFFLLEYFVNDAGELRSSHNTVIDLGSLKDHVLQLKQLLTDNPREVIWAKFSPQDDRDELGWSLSDLLDDVQPAGRPMQFPIDVSLDDASRSSTLGDAIKNQRFVPFRRSDAETSFAARWLPEMRIGSQAAQLTYQDQRHGRGRLWNWNAFTTYPIPYVSEVTNRYVPQIWRGQLAAAQLMNFVTSNDIQTSFAPEFALRQNAAIAKAMG